MVNIIAHYGTHPATRGLFWAQIDAFRLTGSVTYGIGVRLSGVELGESRAMRGARRRCTAMGGGGRPEYGPCVVKALGVELPALRAAVEAERRRE